MSANVCNLMDWPLQSSPMPSTSPRWPQCWREARWREANDGPGHRRRQHTNQNQKRRIQKVSIEACHQLLLAWRTGRGPRINVVFWPCDVLGLRTTSCTFFAARLSVCSDKLAKESHVECWINSVFRSKWNGQPTFLNQEVGLITHQQILQRCSVHVDIIWPSTYFSKPNQILANAEHDILPTAPTNHESAGIICPTPFDLSS